MSTISSAVARPNGSGSKFLPPENRKPAEFAAIEEELSRYGEAVEGAGSVPTRLWTMPDDEAALLGARIFVLADRYLA